MAKGCNNNTGDEQPGFRMMFLNALEAVDRGNERARDLTFVNYLVQKNNVLLGAVADNKLNEADLRKYESD